VPLNQPGTAVAYIQPNAYNLRHFPTSTPMTSRQAKQQEDNYFRVMRILHDSPEITQRELAEKLGLSVSGLNYCLKALIDKGWVKIQNFSNNKNKMGYAYLLTPTGVLQKALLTSNFLQRKMQEYEALNQEIKQIKQEVNGKSSP
jgi:EPS-associated MarR family transcriptional regulator